MTTTQTLGLAERHAYTLAQFEGRKFCSRTEAARYLDTSTTTLDELLYSQQIRSHYHGRLRKVLVKSLLAYAENLPVDRPEAGA